MRELVIDNQTERVYTDIYERYAAKHPSQLSAVFCSLQSNTIFVHRQMVSRSSTRETVDERNAWPQPRYHLSVFCVKGDLQMRPSIESTTEVRTSSESAPTRHYWNLFATDGPADLYRGFAVDAVDEFLNTQGTITDEQMSIITECVNIAALTESEVREIRSKYAPQTCTYVQLAEEYGVSPRTIGEIVNRRKWTHVE
ncbi:MAG: hypothetical protein KF753_05155 [Caldilineaceae bacterium]|nr:hypothetical protein [Caldilineaceae bacterium]